MRGIKIPPQDFGLKMQGGLMREGARICGTLRYTSVYLCAHVVVVAQRQSTLHKPGVLDLFPSNTWPFHFPLFCII